VGERDHPASTTWRSFCTSPLYGYGVIDGRPRSWAAVSLEVKRRAESRHSGLRALLTTDDFAVHLDEAPVCPSSIGSPLGPFSPHIQAFGPSSRSSAFSNTRYATWAPKPPCAPLSQEAVLELMHRPR
jgi:hypothetical protein